MSRYFPMFVSLEGKKVLVVGAGSVAERRTRSLLPFGCAITVVAPQFAPGFREMPGLELVERRFEDGDLEGVWLAVIATDNKEENARIAALCAGRGIIKNVASDMDLCDFRFPALALTGEMTAGLCSTERTPTLTKQMRKKLQEFLDGYHDEN